MYGKKKLKKSKTIGVLLIKISLYNEQLNILKTFENVFIV